MSFTDDFLKELKKKNISITEQGPVGGNSYTKSYLDGLNDLEEERKKRQELMAAVSSPMSSTMDDIGPVAKTIGESKPDLFGLDFFQKGVFEDGYQAGDIAKSILGTATDFTMNIGKGALGLVEGIGDFAMHGAAYGADLLGADKAADKLHAGANKNIVDDLTRGASAWVDQYSVLGGTTDKFAQGIGQMGAMKAPVGAVSKAAQLGKLGTSALSTGTMFASSAGSGISEAYQGNATDGEALAYGTIAGAADAIFELLSGGMGGGLNAVGFNSGLLDLDDLVAKKLTSKISNQLAKNIAEFGIKASGEGLEEVLAGTVQAVAKSKTYMTEKELSDILEDENLLEQFVVGAMTSGAMQSGAIPGTYQGSLIEANKQGKDFITGQTVNEQAVIKKEIEKRIAEQEKDGRKLTAREKSAIEAQVEADLPKGYISTDTIEEVLGGEDFKAYKDTIDSEEALKKQEKDLTDEYNLLNKKKLGDMTGEETDRRDSLKTQIAELQAKIKDTETNSKRDLLKAELSKKVYELSKSDRLVESYLEPVRAKQKFTADLNKYEGKAKEVIKQVMDSGLEDNSNAAHDFWDMAAKVSADTGISISLANNQQIMEMVKAEYEADGVEFDESQFKGQTIDGYKSKNGIVLNAESKRALNWVVGHEITHTMEKSKHYGDLQAILKEYASKEYDSRFKKRMAQYKGKYNGATLNDDVAMEVTADMVGDFLFTDQNFVNHLSTKNRNVFQKMFDEIKYLLKQATAGSKEARELERVKHLFEKAYRDAGKATDADAEKKGKEPAAKPSLSDLSEADQAEAKKIISNLKTRSIASKYGFNSFGSYTAERMDREIKTSSSDTKMDYAKSYITWVEPDDFIYATTGTERTRALLTEEAGELDVERLKNETQPIHLTVDFETGEIVGHEGRHRMLALKAAGVEKVAVIIDAWNDNRSNTKPVSMMRAKGQRFSEYEHGQDFYLHDLLPLSKRYADTAKAVFTNKPKKGVQFSLSEDVKVTESGSVTKFSLSTWTPETQEKVRKNLTKAGFEKERVDKWIKDTNSVAAVIAADKDRLDFEAADNQTMLKNNQEYVKTLDASTLCAKRLVYQGTFDAIQHRMPNTVLTSDDLIDLLNMMKEKNVQTPCGVCYVESRRRHLGKFAQEWLNGYDGEYKPNLDEVTTSDGLEALRKSHPDTYKDFTDAMNKKGSSNPKVVQLRTEYRNEIMSLTPSQIKKIESIGGLRVQSFSDFETPHLLDMMQAVMDMSAKGLTSQAYTKVPNFAWVFGDTGIKINLSLIAEGNGLDADGNLAFSSTEGMDINEALKLRDAYSKNVGTIIVGANDQHILACMADDRIDFIIPFHRSGWGKNELDMMGMSDYTDYTYGQKEHSLETGKGVPNLYPPDYWDYNVSGKENAERYLSLCARTGREPKFSHFLVNNGDGSYSLQPDGSTDGYWKMLIDFKMYDNDGIGSAQQKVQPNFNMDEAYRVLAEYEGGANKLPVANEIVEEFVAKKRGKASISDIGEEHPVYGSYHYYSKYKPTDIAPVQDSVQDSVQTPVQDTDPVLVDEYAPPMDDDIGPVAAPAAQTPVTQEAPVDRQKELEMMVGDKDSFFSNRAAKLYEEVTNLKKGVRASKALGYLLDYGYEWKSLKTALLNIRDNPGQQVNERSAIENIAREMINKEYEDKLYEMGELLDGAKSSKAVKSIRERLAAKLLNYQTELANTKALRDQSNADYDSEIERLQAEYDAKPNKNTVAANNILLRIERMRRMKGNVDADYAKRISDMEGRVAKASEEVRTGESKAEQGAMRRELHQNIMDRIKTRFAEKGFDFDSVLKKAKNLSTFATVDNTPQRVMEKSLGYKEGQVLSDLTVDQVARNETEGIKWLNKYTDKKNGLLAQISKQYNIKPGSKESAAAQMYAEGFYVAENEDIIEYGDKELAKDFPDARVQANIKGLAKDPRVRQVYDETLALINASRARNAYPEIQKLDNYFLHFRAMSDTFSRLGLPFNPNDIKAKDLPTDLNGVTADLKPGQPYFASAMHRKGQRTSFDLLGGLEQYLTSAKGQIYHIDDIQTLRALRNYIADTFGQAKGLEGLDTMTEEEVQERIKEVYGAHLSTFAKFLNEEANTIAGKTALIDRGLEGIIGRRGITFLDTVNRQVGANMVGYNVSSSLTNFLAPVQAFAKTNKADFVKAFSQTVYNKLASINGKGDGFTEQSPVMIRRKGADRFHRTFWQKLSDPGYALMGAVDSFSTELIARAKYNEFTRKGMDAAQAHIEADKWTSRLMGDRSLGQQPHLYNSKMLGIVTKFQLEVRNQLDSQFYDTIQEAKVSNEDIQNAQERNAKTAAKVASTFFSLAVGQHLFGKVFESIAGYNPAFDIIEALAKAFGWDDDEEDEDTVLDNIGQGFMSLMEDMPYSSVLTGGRIPIQSALPISEFFKGKDQYGNEKSRLETLSEAAPYYLLPGGYGQIKKTVAGMNMFSDEHPVAGSYTDSGNLRFPVEDTLLNRAQAAVFGQYASNNARDYFDNERQSLKKNQIQEFVDVDIPIRDYWEYRDGLKKQETLEDKFDYIAGLDLPISKKNILINNVVDRKEPVDLSDYDAYSGYEEFDFATKNPEKYAFFEEVGISYSAYKNGDDDTKDAYDWAYNNPDKYLLSKAAASDVVEYRRYAKDLYDIKADKDASGKTISGSRKEKVIQYLNNLDIDYGERLILFKSEYEADDTYNADIVEYLNGRDDISFEEEVTILKELGFIVLPDGTVQW